MFDMLPLQSPARTFRIAPMQISGLCAWLESLGFRSAAPLSDDELGRMLLGLEVIILHADGTIHTRGEDAAHAATRLLQVCKE